MILPNDDERKTAASRLLAMRGDDAMREVAPFVRAAGECSCSACDDPERHDTQGRTPAQQAANESTAVWAFVAFLALAALVAGWVLFTNGGGR